MARSQEGLAWAVVRGACRGSALSLVGSWTGVSAKAVLGLGVLEGSRAFQLDAQNTPDGLRPHDLPFLAVESLTSGNAEILCPGRGAHLSQSFWVLCGQARLLICTLTWADPSGECPVGPPLGMLV